MSCVFEPIEFCGLKLNNRFVRSATMENLAASDRTPSKDLVALYETLAAGGIGLLITSSVRPDRTWDPHPNGRGMCFDKEAMIPAFKEVEGRLSTFLRGPAEKQHITAGHHGRRSAFLFHDRGDHSRKRGRSCRHEPPADQGARSDTTMGKW